LADVDCRSRAKLNYLLLHFKTRIWVQF
jgi:hypothetical protein